MVGGEPRLLGRQSLGRVLGMLDHDRLLAARPVASGEHDVREIGRQGDLLRRYGGSGSDMASRVRVVEIAESDKRRPDDKQGDREPQPRATCPQSVVYDHSNTLQ